ncbi:alpha/beta-hydrolase [Cadophora sp. DSE1049]|nr:alpha/beta-hydrolase [Cadophora sp. DSE1049]
MEKFTRTATLCMSLCTSLAIAAPCSSNGSAVVDLGYAEAMGAVNATQGTVSYYGLRFAQAPVEDLRWRAPVSIETSSNMSPKPVLNATQYGPQCVQGSPLWIGNEAGTFPLTSSPDPAPVRESSEDCLLLDVIVPQQPKHDSLPVIVQIHGGGYTIGSSSSSDGHTFVTRSNGSLIWVQIQYRLGAYGFLGGGAVVDDGDTNIGLLDQRLALQWVQKYISAFGGDPTKVTIWGASAGGGSVVNNLIAYGGQDNPPFRAAIGQYPWMQPFHDHKTLNSQFQLLLAATNCTDIACLRSLDYGTLANATQKTYVDGYASGLYGFGDFFYGPYIDGKFIRAYPSQEWAQGHFSKVPMLLDHDEFEEQLAHAYYRHDIHKFFDQYNGGLASPQILNFTKQQTNYWKTQDLFGDTFVNCGTYHGAIAAGNAGVPVWKLIFAAGNFFHGASFPYLFYRSSTTANSTLADKMKDYYQAFVVDLDPNSGSISTGSSRPFWPQYTSGSGNLQVLQVNETNIGVQDDTDANGRCDFWGSQPYFAKS